MTTWWARRMDAEHGTAAVSTVMLLVLLLTVGAAAVIGVTDLAAATARARTAADAAALAAAGTSPLVAGAHEPRDTPADAARRVAQANDARLLAIRLAQWPLRVTVEVQVEPATAWVRRAAGRITATAAAAVRPRDG